MKPKFVQSYMDVARRFAALSTARRLIANLGKKQSIETIIKRLNSLLSNDKAYERKYWLFVSPDKIYHFTKGKRNKILHQLGLSEGSSFRKYLNKDIPSVNGKNKGWIFYEGKDTIEQILKHVNKERIIVYE